jgi:hypothetical protein
MKQVQRNERFGNAILEKEPSSTGAMFFDQKRQMNELKQLDNKIDATLHFKPTNAEEFRKEENRKKKEAEKKKEKGALEEVSKSFRLKQPL